MCGKGQMSDTGHHNQNNGRWPVGQMLIHIMHKASAMRLAMANIEQVENKMHFGDYCPSMFILTISVDYGTALW